MCDVKYLEWGEHEEHPDVADEEDQSTAKPVLNVAGGGVVNHADGLVVVTRCVHLERLEEVHSVGSNDPDAVPGLVLVLMG